MPKVVYLVKSFPQITQTYIKNEAEAMSEDFDVFVIANKPPNKPCKTHVPFEIIPDRDKVLERVKELKPDVLHTHWLYEAPLAGWVSKKAGIPFTVRAHSFDILPTMRKGRIPGFVRNLYHHLRGGSLITFLKDHSIPGHMVHAAKYINTDLCLGVLAFPFGRELMVKAGIDDSKIIDAFPVVKYDMFHNEEPNGDAVMNMGAALPKKKMTDFIKLASLVPDKVFNLYEMGYNTEGLEKKNNRTNPVNFIEPIDQGDMLSHYKKHGWLVYTACKDYMNVGWPMAIAEAQAAGLGVCVSNIRPDLKQYIGGAGFVFDDIEEVVDIIKKPYPEHMREAGFKQAKKSDIKEHKRVLAGLWNKGLNV